MSRLHVVKIEDKNQAPYHLLLLADPSAQAIDYYLENGSCYVAYLDNVVIGVYVLLPTRPFTVELVNLAIEHKYQGHGYGKELVFHSKEVATKKGYKILEVGTGNSSIGQLALYQKCGFNISSIDFNFFEKHYPNSIFENGIKCSHMIRLTIDL